ncbi:porin [Ketogulonicigenium vulgare]|nr:porin [Ketogulonicigenium vulgare]ADO43890.1 conserved hypothetical protein [Ketogulonicigenium vulgare Y25]AOZ55924.1 putative porin [Ketogulonicigenium vulgare]
MKRILLASAALTAFAGAAAAEISFNGDARLGYNDTAIENDGFYWRLRMNIAASQELDNGLTFGGSVRFDLIDNGYISDPALDTNNLKLFLEAGELGGLYFGDYEFSAVDAWKAAGPMFADGFSEQDGEKTLRGDINYGNVAVSVSTPISSTTGNDNASESQLGQWNFAASTTFGAFDVVFAYQGEGDDDYFAEAALGDDINPNEIIGLSVGTTFAGASVRLAYATTDYKVAGTTQSSLGLTATYPLGPVALTGWVIFEDGDVSDAMDEDLFYGARVAYAANGFSISADYGERLANNLSIGGRDARLAVEGGYDLGNGINLKAGYLSRDSWSIGSGEAYYVGGTYDLGAGATLLVSYADADDTSAGYLSDDEVGAPAYQNGATIEVSFKF